MKCDVMDALHAKWTARLYFMDGCAVKCGGKYPLLAKCILQLYFTGNY